jgi:hypothetical protein
MRRKRGNTNIKILQSQIQNFAIKEEKNDESIAQRGQKNEIKGSGVSNAIVELPVVEKIKKKGIKKDELINTKRLLTM